MNIGSLGGQSLSSLYASVYKKLDADSSGGVSVDELGQGLSGATSSNTKDATKLFSAMDTDSDGSLTSTEVTSYFQSNLSLDTLTGAHGAGAQGADRGGPPKGPPPSGGPGGGQPPSLSDIDSDEDGSISKSEMQTFGSTAMGETDTTKSDAIFDAMDTDQDGTVSANEKAAFDEQMAAKASENGGPKGAGVPSPLDAGSDPASSDITSIANADAAVQKLTSQWLQSLYASLSAGTSSLTESLASNASTVSVTA